MRLFLRIGCWLSCHHWVIAAAHSEYWYIRCEDCEDIQKVYLE